MALTQTAKAYQSYVAGNQARTVAGAPTIVAGPGTIVSSSKPSTPPVSNQYNSASPPATPPKTSSGPTAKPAVANAATSSGTPPALGYGGAAYGSNAATNRALEANRVKLNSDPAFKQSEINRSLGVIQSRQAAGMDTTEQVNYLNSLGYKGDTVINETPPVNKLPPGGMNGTPYVSGYTGPDTAGMTGQIKDIHDNSYAAQLQLLKQALQTRLQGLDTQAAAAKQNAYETSNQADATNLQNEQRMKETVANAGLRTDGQNLTLQAAQNASRMGALTDINNQRDAALNDIQGQRSVAQNNAAANELALRQGLDADQAKAMLDLMYYGDDKAYQVDQSNYGRYADQRDFTYRSGQDQIQNDAQYGGTYNGNQTVAQQQQAWDNRFNYGNAIGQFGNGQQTVAKQQFEYGKTQDQISNNQWQQNFDRTKYESDRNYQFQVQQQSIQNGQWQQQFNQDVEKFGFQKSSEMWSQAFQENQEKQDDSYRKQQLQQEMTQSERQAITQASTAIANSGLVSKTTDMQTGAETMSVTNPQSLNNYIKSLNLSDNATDALLYQYGLDSYVKK